MPPKKKEQGASKKAAQKQKNKIIEDKTFGLKNKNKSKKVQQHIQSVTKNVMNSGDRRERQLEEARRKQKADMKARKKAQKDEQDALFGDALLAIGKKKTTNQKEGKTEAKGRDGDDEGVKKGTSRAMKMMYQMDAQEMEERLKEDPNYVPTIEDQIESQRQKKVEELKKSGKGTPITPETFAVWQEKKRKKRAEAAKKLVEAEMRKKKGGKGLSVLSGRDLFGYKRDFFEITEDQVDGPSDNEDNGDDGADNDEKKAEATVEAVATKVQSNLFLEGDEDDLDDLDDLDDD